MRNPFRKALATVRLWMVRARRFWTTAVPDCFTLLNWLFFLAGVRFDSQNGSHRFGWKLFLGVGYCQMVISLVGCVSAFVIEGDPLQTIWCVIMVVALGMSLIKINLVFRHNEEINELREFLGAEGFSSGDLEFDVATRNRYQKRSKGLLVTFGIVMVFEQVFSWIPTRQQMRTFYVPPWIGECFGQGFAAFLRMIYISLFAFYWMTKMYGCTIISTILMMGMQAEQEILVHHFGRIEEALKDLRENYYDSEQCKQYYWDRLRSLTKETMDHQVLILSKLQKLRPLVERLFFYLYYFALIMMGSSFFIVVSGPMSFMLFGVGVTIIIMALECYLTSYLVECLKNSFSDISGHVFTVGSQLPYSLDYHQEYLAMRATLITVGLCSQNIVQFACPGISDISVVVFAQLMNTSYSVLTFLLKVV